MHSALNRGIAVQICNDALIVKPILKLIVRYQIIFSEGIIYMAKPKRKTITKRKKNGQFNGSQSLVGKESLKIKVKPISPILTKPKTPLFPKGLPLSITHPKLTLEANGWDTSTVTYGSHAIKQWKCIKAGHTWDASVQNRTLNGTGCWGCVNVPLLFLKNLSLDQTHPYLALEAYKWDTSTSTYGSHEIKEWKCRDCNYIWPAMIKDRTLLSSACPECSKSGFHNTEPAYLYWIIGAKDNISFTQFGITKNIKERFGLHGRNGFNKDYSKKILYFELGQEALNLENIIKRKLLLLNVPSVKEDKGIVVKFDGYTESFRTKLFPTGDLKDFLKKLDITPEGQYEWVSPKANPIKTRNRESREPRN
jgi:hypothetical protein